MTSWGKIETPYDGKSESNNLECMGYTKGCKRGRAISCLYDGNHGTLYDFQFPLTWWFWNTKYDEQPTSNIEFLN